MKIIIEDVGPPTTSTGVMVLSIITTKGRKETMSREGGRMELDLPQGSTLLSASVGERYIGEVEQTPSGAMMQERHRRQQST